MSKVRGDKEPQAEQDNELVILLRLLEGSRYPDSVRVMTRGRLVNLIRNEAMKQLNVNGYPNKKLIQDIKSRGLGRFKLTIQGGVLFRGEIVTRKGKIVFTCERGGSDVGYPREPKDTRPDATSVGRDLDTGHREIDAGR